VPTAEPDGAPRRWAALARRALAEDRVRADVTTRALLDRPVPAEGVVTAQARGILSGGEVVREIAREAGVRVRRRRPDGRPVRPSTVVLVVRGDARRLLAVERTVLNVLMHASGVATETGRAVRAARGGRRPLEIWATRKTLPGLRALEKQAVVDGGGRAHRAHLAAAVLVKNNHLEFVTVAEAVRRARRRAGRGRAVEVEVRSLAEALAAARAGADAILLDNLAPRRARRIVRALERAGLRRARWIELSGGLTPGNVGRFRDVGADAASLGSLTHSAPALPFRMRIRPLRLRRPAP
jgi:nicotinate-nucleotide pyrophosphorylase (carboxylating)